MRSASPWSPVVGSRRLPAKRPDLAFAGVLGDEPEPPWADDFGQVAIGGEGMLDEVVFLHRDSGTIILTDMCAHADDSWPLGSRLASRVSGIYEHHAPPIELRWLMGRHKPEIRRVIDTILAHGALVPAGAKAVFERAYAFAQGW